ncbi:sporulation integral membrane protein YtvI [Ammoniphilus oxalaticus]|uniref:Sporulation integral membrane protein YtvI n=1 Tax=Ammoniphilus oxalaticus TaxID=66863 RepID=A0A419SIB7_9BACL|nr:sporulation integral membrane protein YtvI [Ammoniphilus oxalaticus]RKD23784.1 sporulation integral membrane protein YtvI [Ammoniphilus oxalaticus]
MDPEWLKNLGRFFRFAWVSTLIIISVWFIKFALPLLYPFILALIIAFLINRPVNWLEARAKLPRWAATLIALSFVLSIVAGLFILLISQLVIETAHLIAVLPSQIQEATDYINRYISTEIITNFYDNIHYYYSSLNEGYKTSIENYVSEGLSRIAKTGTFLIQALLNGLQAFLTSLPNAATAIVISTLASFFISKDFYKIKDRAFRMMPPFIEGRITGVAQDLKKALFGFIKAQVTLVSITGFIVVVGLLILRVEYAFTVGVITGIVDLLPLLGTGFVFVPWIVYLFIQGNYNLVIGLSILYAVIVIQRQIMEPKIVADNIGLDPLITLMAIFVGLRLFGVLGLIIGPISVVILNALINAHIFQDLWTYVVGKKAND